MLCRCGSAYNFNPQLLHLPCVRPLHSRSQILDLKAAHETELRRAAEDVRRAVEDTRRTADEVRRQENETRRSKVRLMPPHPIPHVSL